MEGVSIIYLDEVQTKRRRSDLAVACRTDWISSKSIGYQPKVVEQWEFKFWLLNVYEARNYDIKDMKMGNKNNNCVCY